MHHDNTHTRFAPSVEHKKINKEFFTNLTSKSLEQLETVNRLYLAKKE